MTNLQWGDEYNIGIREIDLQHMEFINIVNKIHWANEHGYPVEIGERFVHELYKYAEFHFACETNMMFLHKYPKFVEHERCHRHLLSVLRVKISAFSSGEASYDSFTGFAFKWLVSHIYKEDKKYGTFMAEKSA